MFETCETPETLVIRFPGRMDSARCAAMEGQVRETLAAAGLPIVFDLQGVDFVCSAFLRICVVARRQADQPFRIINVDPAIKRVFKISGLDGMLHDA